MTSRDEQNLFLELGSSQQKFTRHTPCGLALELRALRVLRGYPITLSEVPEWTTIKLEDVERREQLGGVIKSMHRKTA